jgi:hypothetical protein
MSCLARLVRSLASRRGSALLVLPLLAAACGSTTANDAPIIDSIDAPLVVSERDGTYAIPVTVLFHDNDGEAITRLRYRLAPDIDGTVDVPAPNPTRESAEVTIVIRAADLDGDVPTTRSRDTDDDDKTDGDKRERGRSRNRARALELRIIDYRGAESLPQSSTVTLD